MSSRRLTYFGFLAAAASLLFISAPGVRAQDDVSYARVVRLSRVIGEVSVAHAGAQGWESASVNLPLQEGDSLATGNGRAEIEFESGATAYLDENSVVEFTKLSLADGNRITQLTLTQGTASFYANPAGADSFGVLTSNLQVSLQGRAEFRIDLANDGATVEVSQGRVTVNSSVGTNQLEKGQSLSFLASDPPGVNIGGLPALDDFDKWVSQTTQAEQSGYVSAQSYVNSPYLYGLADLSMYGGWYNVAPYGMVWQPYGIGYGWSPYYYGSWQNGGYGLCWISSEPWGWMPYHFGSWIFSPGVGWIWIPGPITHWSPARVNWVQVGNRTGWVPIGPHDRGRDLQNLPRGVIMQPGKPGWRSGTPHELLVVNDAKDVKVVHQAPHDFAPNPARIASSPASNPAIARTSRRGLISPPVRGVDPPAAGVTSTIVYDRSTRTFINSNAPAGPTLPAEPQPFAGTREPYVRARIPSPEPGGPRVATPYTPPAPGQVNVPGAPPMAPHSGFSAVPPRAVPQPPPPRNFGPVTRSPSPEPMSPRGPAPATPHYGAAPPPAPHFSPPPAPAPPHSPGPPHESTSSGPIKH